MTKKTTKVKKVKEAPTPDKVYDKALSHLSQKLGGVLYDATNEGKLPVSQGLQSFTVARDRSKVSFSFYADESFSIGKLIKDLKGFEAYLFGAIRAHFFVNQDSIRFEHESSYESCSHYLVFDAEIDSWDEAEALQPAYEAAEVYLAEKAAIAAAERKRKDAENKRSVEKAEREILARLKAKYEPKAK